MSELNVKLYFRVAFLVLFLPYVSGDCIDLDLGMESGSIPDNNITASSEKNANTTAKNGRLNSGSSWCAGTGDSAPYLQIDLQTLHIICAVSTQGNSQADQWVKTYKLKLSTDGSTWTNYKESGQVKSLTGNEDKNSEVKHILYGGVFARYLQFLPETHHGAVCFRTELFGVKLKPENLALGKPTAQSSTFSDSSIGSAVSGRAVDGNPDTNMTNKHCSQTNANNPSWWRVDLESGYVPVSQIYIVNRFSPGDPTETSKDYEITLGSSTDVTANSNCSGRYTFVKFKASAVCFTNPLTTGRYVGIKTTKSQALQLCEVEIYSRENQAFNKQTRQSSLAYGGESSRGVDGNSTTVWEASSCTHTNKEDKAWWMVDLGKVEHVTEVYIVNRNYVGERLSNFEIRVGTISIDGGVTNPKCGSMYSVPQGEGLSFFCHPCLYGRYVTIRSLLDAPLTLCEVEVYSERRACPMQSIGVASKDAFPDSSFSASSTRSGNDAFKDRLYGDGAWSPTDNNNSNDYLQIDLLYEFVICAVATQGKSTADHWTTKYKLQLSYNGSSWVIYQENNTDKEFNGNSGRNDIVKHSLKEYASARFIRFQPTNYSGHKALRVEVFGVLVSRVPSQAPSGLTLAASTSTSITASWQLPPEYARHGNITGFKLFYKEKDSVRSPFNITINDGGSYTKDITGLSIYTEYEFQVLAFTSKGEGPKSSVVVERTMEDVSPSIIEDVSPSSVICEMETLCSLSCHATSDIPFNYSWTKNGQVPVGDDIKIMNNIIVLTPRDADDYGVYVCHVTNSFGSTSYKITLSEDHKSSALTEVKRTLNATVSTLSCLVFILLLIIGVVTWRARRALPVNRATTADKVITDNVGQSDAPRDQHVSEPSSYMELHPRPSEGQSHATPEYTSLQDKDHNTEYYNVGFCKRGNAGKRKSPHDQHVSEPATYMELQPRPSGGQSHALPEYKSLQGTKKNPGYYNVGFNKGNKRDKQEELYDEVGNAQC